VPKQLRQQAAAIVITVTGPSAARGPSVRCGFQLTIVIKAHPMRATTTTGALVPTIRHHFVIRSAGQVFLQFPLSQPASLPAIW
jgi:hypothetical protein